MMTSPVPLLAPAFSVGSPAPSTRSTSTAGPSYLAASPPAASSKNMANMTNMVCSVCSVCNKTFHRRCDLNRHQKTHDRPFKCQIQGCEYQARGFPTDQERKRHVNDRHADAPAIYSCTSDGCSYRSKRESNLKQHKEKAHDWTYDRSRPRNRRRAGQAGNHAQDNGQGQGQTPAPSHVGPPLAGNNYNLPLGFSDFQDFQDFQTTPLLDHQHVHVAWEEIATENQLSSFLLSTESQLASFPPQQTPVLTPYSWTPVVPTTPNAAPAPAPYLGPYHFAGPVAGMPFAAYPMIPSTSLPLRQAASPHNTAIDKDSAWI